MQLLTTLFPSPQSKVGEFLRLVGVTLQSYMATYRDGGLEEDSEESQFVLALCGTITSKCEQYRSPCVSYWYRLCHLVYTATIPDTQYF